MSALAARVKAVNAAHQCANELFPLLQQAFAPFVGLQVTKKDGTLLEKVKKNLPETPNSHRLQVYRHSSNYSMAFTVKTSEMIGDTHTCLYYETTVYVGDLQNGILTKLTDNYSPARTDYTVNEITQKRQALADAQKAVDAIRSTLGPFHERYDN